MQGITVQNEPEAIVPWESCLYTPEVKSSRDSLWFQEERDFVRDYLGPQMAQDHPNLTIMIYDHNKDHIVEWAQGILSDPQASKYVKGTAFHWYSGRHFIFQIFLTSFQPVSKC